MNDLAIVSENNLKDFKEAADSLGMRFMLQEGTLLGAYRDKDFVVNDESDIDLGIMEDQFDKCQQVIDILLSKGFENNKRVIVDNEFHGGALTRGGCHIDLMKMIKEGSQVYNLGDGGDLRYDYDAKIFDGYSKIMFRGMEFDAPADIEGFLTARYGDWKTPISNTIYNYSNPIFSPNVKRTEKENLLDVGDLKFYVRNDKHDEPVLAHELMNNVYKIGQPKVVVDIGAHIGGTTCLCAYSGANVYAYEPSKKNFCKLVRNVRLNGLEDRVKMFKLAIGTPGKRKLYYHDNNYGCFSFNRNNTINMVDDWEEVDTISIKDVFKDIEHCDLLKCDCEGGEEEFYMDIPHEKIDQISMEVHRPNGIKDYLSQFYKVEEYGTDSDKVLICKK
jgi:FkbM family methyltransferase